MNFKEWCEQTNHTEYLSNWDYDLTPFRPEDISFRSSSKNKKIFLKCPRGLHPSTPFIADRLVARREQTCKMCNSFGQFFEDKYGKEWLDSVWSERNPFSPYSIQRSCATKVWINCLKNPKHGLYYIKANAFYNADANNNNGCPYCHIRGTTTVKECDSVANERPDVYRYWSDRNDRQPTQYSKRSHQIVYWKCPDGIHGDFARMISESCRYDFRCPLCSTMSKTSALERKVSTYMEKLGYTVKHEYECNILPERPWVQNNRYLPFDNEVEELKLIIEVNGRQHYELRSWHDHTAKRRGTSATYEFEQAQERDRYKEQYAIDHGYDYLVIPYYMEDNDRYIDEINKKIAEITERESVTTTAQEVTTGHMPTTQTG